MEIQFQNNGTEPTVLWRYKRDKNMLRLDYDQQHDLGVSEHCSCDSRACDKPSNLLVPHVETNPICCGSNQLSAEKALNPWIFLRNNTLSESNWIHWESNLDMFADSKKVTCFVHWFIPFRSDPFHTDPSSFNIRSRISLMWILSPTTIKEME